MSTLSCSLPVKFFWLSVKVPAIKVQLALWNPSLFWPNLSIIRKQSYKHIQFTQENICIYSCLTHDRELYQKKNSQLFVFSVCYISIAYFILYCEDKHQVLANASGKSTQIHFQECRVTGNKSNYTYYWHLSCYYNEEWQSLGTAPSFTALLTTATWVHCMYKAVNLSYLVCFDNIFVCVLYAAANRRQIFMHDESAPLVCSVHCSWSRWCYHNLILLTPTSYRFMW